MELEAAHAYSQTSPEEDILKNHYNDLQRGIADPISIASQLVQGNVVEMALVSKLHTMSCSLQIATVLDAVICSIRNNPRHFQVLLSILENTAESATLAKKMRKELTYSKLKIMLL